MELGDKGHTVITSMKLVNRVHVVGISSCVRKSYHIVIAKDATIWLLFDLRLFGSFISKDFVPTLFESCHDL